MMFLAPTAALVAAAIGIPVLAVLYLLKLRRRPVRVSSTLLWQQAHDDLEANIPWRVVRPSWLVLLHLLVVMLAILAIGRPAIGTGSAAASRIIFIIDRSASMSAMDGFALDGSRVSRLNEAQQRALKIVEDSMRLGRDVETAVIAAAGDSRAMVGLSSDRRLIRSAIESITPSDQPLNLDEAMRHAGALLGTSGDEESESERSTATAMIIVVSDGWTGADGITAPSGTSIRLERVGPSATTDTSAQTIRGYDNAGIIAMNARRDAVNPANVRVFIELANAQTASVERIVMLLMDGVEVQRQGVQLPPSDATGPGRRAITMDISTRGGGLITAQLDGSDVLAADDRASMLLAAPRPPSILLVARANTQAESSSTTDDQPFSSQWLIESVLAELRPALLRVERGPAALQAAASAAGTYDLVVFDGVTPTTLPPVPSIILGGGLPALGVTQNGPQQPGQREFILSWERTHPVLRDVTLDTVYGTASSGLAIQNAQGVRTTQLALGAGAPLIALIEANGLRHIVTSMGIDDSNWGVQVGFAIFLSNAVDYLTLRSDEQARSAIRIADVIEVDVPPSTTTAVLDGPQRREFVLPPEPQGSTDRRVSLGRVERVGVYKLTPDKARPPVVAVNLMDPGETGVRTQDSIPVRGRSGGTQTAADDGLPREITPEILIALLILLAVEWVAFAWTSRV